jgi:hypothetical protein
VYLTPTGGSARMSLASLANLVKCMRECRWKTQKGTRGTGEEGKTKGQEGRVPFLCCVLNDMWIWFTCHSVGDISLSQGQRFFGMTARGGSGEWTDATEIGGCTSLCIGLSFTGAVSGPPPIVGLLQRWHRQSNGPKNLF